MKNVQSWDFRKRILPSLAAIVTAIAPAGSEAYSPGRTASSWKFEAQSVVKNLIGCGPIVEEGTHPLLTRKSIELYEKTTGKKFTTAEKNLMAKGAIQEDSPEFCYARSMNHFTEMGTHQGIWGFASSQEWAQSTKAQSGMMPVDNLPFGIKQFYQWMVSKIKGFYPEGNHSWERAVTEKNLESLGHVLHLVQDLTAPAHVRNDKHPGPVGLNFEEANIHTYIHGDSYEGWAEDNSKLALLTPTTIPTYTSLDAIFNDVVQFTGEHFFSDNSIGAYATPALKDLTEKKGMLLVYYYNTINGKEVPIARKSFLTTILNEVGKKNVQNYVLDAKVMEEQWKILGTRAVEMGAAVIALYVKETSGPECSSHVAKVCSGNAVYWKDSCGKLEDKVQSCGSTQTCVDAQCVDNKPTCTPQYTKICSNGDVYWEDSCGKLGNVVQSCMSGEKCEGGACITQNNQFLDLGDGTVKDTKTGYIWQKDTSQKLKGYDADSYCNNLILGGVSKWSLPTTTELKSIHWKYSPSWPYTKCMFPSELSGDCDFYWSTEKCAGAFEGHEVIDFGEPPDYSSFCVNDASSYTARCIKK